MNPLGYNALPSTSHTQQVDINTSRSFEYLKKTFTILDANNQLHSFQLSIDFVQSIIENFSNVLNVNYAQAHYNTVSQTSQTATLDLNFLFVPTTSDIQEKFINDFHLVFENWFTTQLNLDGNAFESFKKNTTYTFQLSTFPNFINFTFSFIENAHFFSENLVPFLNEINLKKCNEDCLNVDIYDDLLGAQPRITHTADESASSTAPITAATPTLTPITATIPTQTQTSAQSPAPAPTLTASSSELPKPVLSATAEEQENHLKQMADKQIDCKQRAQNAHNLFSMSCKLNKDRQQRAINEVRTIIYELKKTNPLLAYQLFVDALSKIPFIKLEESNPKVTKISEELLGLISHITIDEETKEKFLTFTSDLFTHLLGPKSKIGRDLLAKLLTQSIHILFNNLINNSIPLQTRCIETILDLILTSSHPINHLDIQKKIRLLFLDGLLKNDLFKMGCTLVLKNLENSSSESKKIAAEIKHITDLIITHTPAELIEENLKSFSPFIENGKGIFDQILATKMNAHNFINIKDMLFSLSIDRFRIFFKSFLNKYEDEIVDRNSIEKILTEALNKISDQPSQKLKQIIVSEEFPLAKLNDFPKLKNSVLSITNPEEKSLINALRELFPNFAYLLEGIKDPSSYQEIKDVVLTILSQIKGSEAKNNIIESLCIMLRQEEGKLKNKKNPSYQTLSDFYGLQICVLVETEKYFDKAIEIFKSRNDNSILNENNFKSCFEIIYRHALLNAKVAKLAPVLARDCLTQNQIFISKLLIIKIQLSEFLNGNWKGFDPEQSAKELDILVREYKGKSELISKELIDLVTNYACTLDDINNAFIRKFDELFSSVFKNAESSSYSTQKVLPSLEIIRENYINNPENHAAILQYISYCEGQIKGSSDFSKSKDTFIVLANLYEELRQQYKNNIEDDPSLTTRLKAAEFALTITYMLFCKLLYKVNSIPYFQFAIAAYNKLESLYPDSIQLTTLVRPYLFEIGNSGIQKRIKSDEIYYNLSKAQYQSGNIKETLAHFEKVTEKPNAIVTIRDLSEAATFYSRMNKWEKAFEMIEKLLTYFQMDLNKDLLEYYLDMKIKLQHALQLKSEAKLPPEELDSSNYNSFNNLTDLLKHFLTSEDVPNEFYANNLINLLAQTNENEIKNIPFLAFFIHRLIVVLLNHKDFELAVDLFISASKYKEAIFYKYSAGGSDLHKQISLALYTDSGEKHFSLLLDILEQVIKYNYDSRHIVEVVLQSLTTSQIIPKILLLDTLYIYLNRILTELLDRYIVSPNETFESMAEILTLYYPIILCTFFTPIPQFNHTLELLQKVNESECAINSEDDKLSVAAIKSITDRFNLSEIKAFHDLFTHHIESKDINPIIFNRYIELFNSLPPDDFTTNILVVRIQGVIYSIFDFINSSDDRNLVESFVTSSFDSVSALIRYPRFTEWLKEREAANGPCYSSFINTIQIIDTLVLKYQDAPNIVEGLSNFKALFNNAYSQAIESKATSSDNEKEVLNLDYLDTHGTICAKMKSAVTTVLDISLNIDLHAHGLAFGSFKENHMSNIFPINKNQSANSLSVFHSQLTHVLEDLMFVYEEHKAYLENKSSKFRKEFIAAPNMNDTINYNLNQIMEMIIGAGGLLAIIYNNLHTIGRSTNFNLNSTNGVIGFDKFLEHEITKFKNWNQRIPNVFDLPMCACLLIFKKYNEALVYLEKSDQSRYVNKSLYLQTLYNLRDYKKFVQEFENTEFRHVLINNYVYAALSDSCFQLEDWDKSIHYSEHSVKRLLNMALVVSAHTHLLKSVANKVWMQKVIK